MQEIKTPYEISVWKEKEQLYSSGSVVTLVKIDLYSTLPELYSCSFSFQTEIS